MSEHRMICLKKYSVLYLNAQFKQAESICVWAKSAPFYVTTYTHVYFYVWCYCFISILPQIRKNNGGKKKKSMDTCISLVSTAVHFAFLKEESGNCYFF